ncbi:MAG TPA: type II toxin-antitoxin system VapC family toxin [Bryobacteraceae bacterium]|nr:type II toxin-antitoxin system VapC family toxin [Bryobacteraceae bacterium]
MTYLDTHVAVWLYEGDRTKLSSAVAKQIESDTLLVSPAVLLEIEYLHERKKLTVGGSAIIRALSRDIGLSICNLTFAAVAESALDLRWTRDPFDRLIVAHAAANDAPLLTKEAKIRRHYERAIW